MYRYSGRLSWTAQTNSFSKLLAQKRLDGVRLLDLTISNPTEALAAYPHAAIAGAYGSIKSFDYHPDPLGQLDARERIASWYAERGISIPSSRLALTASTSEAYSLLFKLLLNGGEDVLIPTPSYPLFEYLAQLEGVALRPYRLLYDGSWHIDFESLERAITPATRAIVVVNPNNPTGSFLKEDEVVRLEEIALARGLPLIADEVFMDYAFAPSPNRVATLIGRDRALSFSLNGLSKSAGMPQMKLGWIAVNGPKAEREQALQRLELLLDTYLSVATPVQNALGELLRIGQGIRSEILNRLLLNRKTLDALPDDIGVHALHCEGGWSATLRVPNVWTDQHGSQAALGSSGALNAEPPRSALPAFIEQHGSQAALGSSGALNAEPPRSALPAFIEQRGSQAALGSSGALNAEPPRSALPAFIEDIWITRLLEEHSVVVQPGYFFDMPMDGCLLISLLTEPSVFGEGLKRLAALARTAG